ncbi:uncharacterized protein LOC115214517 [Octopus sinensis]|uniref:Uncharacterized protein LOC115214517 n=1 Tax=Octopus sinensis TaxID=2607531 RepID=A0A6P7SNX6_9MOLL|nr:uncharacterized protein LOC115214517 [Octopus sinensis]
MVLFKTNIPERQFHQFSQLDSLKDELIDEDLTTYRSYLQSLHDNMVERFHDVIALNIPIWYNNPFEVEADHCEDDVQEELIELQNENDATVRYCRNGRKESTISRRCSNRPHVFVMTVDNLL